MSSRTGASGARRRSARLSAAPPDAESRRRARPVGDRSGVADIICTVALGADRHAHPPLWPEVKQPSLDTPERLLLDQIAAGELDHHLVAIADAVHARRALLHTVRAATAIAELCIGDTVRINRKRPPRLPTGRARRNHRPRRSQRHGPAPAPDRTIPQRRASLSTTRARQARPSHPAATSLNSLSIAPLKRSRVSVLDQTDTPGTFRSGV